MGAGRSLVQEGLRVFPRLTVSREIGRSGGEGFSGVVLFGVLT